MRTERGVGTQLAIASSRTGRKDPPILTRDIAITKSERRWRRRRRFGVFLLIMLPAGMIVFRRPLFTGNFGVVDPDRVFRSAQPAQELDSRIFERRLVSILNL